MLYRVVIVEDDPMVSLLDRTFTEKDTRFRVVQTFQDGQAALDWLAQNPTDLVVLDVYMPLLTGLELLQTLRRRDIPVDAIMVTAANDTATVDHLLKLGVVDYLVKPFTCERFQQALDTFCRHREAVAGGEVTQGALDKLFSPAGQATHSAPKGLQESTLELIRQCLRDAPPQGLPSETIARQTSLSVVTVRRYVNYLVERGEASSTVNYDTGGRPCRLYRPQH
ncbi:response regulator [uncultured Intestinimonas sp.]|uniref:response regulator n=1 Tax=uncultured Intestinimonas sp. TaxID=1689265 RepID=UPI0025F1435C|nr:response regulator [uncultured Intestinimonas sp.]